MGKFAGMTVNERLYAADLLPPWHRAVEQRDRDAMVDLLTQVELGDQADAISDSILNRIG